MRKYFIILFIIITCQISYGQDKSIFSSHQLSVDFGSYRNRYLYPITDISYSSPLLNKVNLKFSARLRSYGTLYFFSKSAYDITPLAEYYFTKTLRPVYFSAGIGLDARLRLTHDERSDVTSSIEPFVSLAIHGNYKFLSIHAPLWTRFYSNGISLQLLPEADFKVSKRFSLFFRYEISYLTLYKTPTHEWRQDCFLGLNALL
jgi:hypothetical protein